MTIELMSKGTIFTITAFILISIIAIGTSFYFKKPTIPTARQNITNQIPSQEPTTKQNLANLPPLPILTKSANISWVDVRYGITFNLKELKTLTDGYELIPDKKIPGVNQLLTVKNPTVFIGKYEDGIKGSLEDIKPGSKLTTPVPFLISNEKFEQGEISIIIVKKETTPSFSPSRVSVKS